MKLIVALALAVLSSSAVLAQSPYAGMQTREIKSLSDEQIADLEAGRGMGLALAAELNGYPGPRHVLDLADKLALTAEQKQQIQALFDAMQAEAKPLGAQLLAQEQALNRQFAERTITAASLKTATAEIGATQARLRDTHLKYHLQTAQILSAGQAQRYAMLRGYTSNAPAHQQHRMQHQHMQ